MSLAVHNPQQVRVVDRVDERATLLLSRADIRRSSDAGQIFAWLFAQTGGRAGTVRDVSLSQIMRAVDCSESGARKWLKLLAARGLITIAERAKRLDPYVIHVLEATPAVAQRTFEFMPEPAIVQPVMRVVRDVIDTVTSDESRAPMVRTNGTHQRYAPTVRTAEPVKGTARPNDVNETEVVAVAAVGSSSDAWIADDELPLARDSQRVRASNHQVHTKSNSYQLQVSKDDLCQETRARRAIEARESGRLDTPQTIGAAFAESLLQRKGVLCFEANEQGIAQLEEQVMAILPKQAGKYPCPSMPALRHICEAAVLSQDADGKNRYPPAKVLSCASWVMSRKGVKSPWALFFDRSGDQMAEVGLTRYQAKGGVQ